MTARRHYRPFSPDEDDFIRQNRERLPNRQIAAILGRTAQAVSNHAVDLGLPRPFVGGRYQPPLELWLEIARSEAVKASVRPCDVIGGSLYPKHVRARWAAFRRIKDENPRFSVKGIATVAGFHHASLFHAFRKLRAEPASPL